MQVLKYKRDPNDPADWPRWKWNGRALREWRAHKRLSLVTFALQVGSTKSYISRMERNDDINPPAALVYTIIRRTGLIDELFELELE